jgi:hypothetical protein
MRAAAAALEAANSLDGLAELLRAVRLADGTTLELPHDNAIALGLEDWRGLRLVGSVGALRILLVDVEAGSALRKSVERLAARLASRAPHVLWILAVRDVAAKRSAIVTWQASDRAGSLPGRRVVAFTWEPSRPVDSDAETLCALHAAYGGDDEVLHSRVLEILGRESLTRRFYRALESRVTALSRFVPGRDADGARAITLLYVSRLLFLSFIEAKGWLDGDRGFLAGRFDHCMASGGNYHRRVLLPLFFGTLNTPARRRARTARAFGRVPFLNGGLFARTPVERGRGRWLYPDEEIGLLFSDVFQRYRFVAREDSLSWSEASVDPEMLGRAFESLMSAGERKAGGVFFTPQRLVARVTDEAFTAWTRELRDLRHVRVLDPACGSGAFLVHVLERLAEARRAAGEDAPIAELRRDVLAQSIFGVDRNPTAVWLCELRLWLSVVIELDEADPMRVPPLPNLDRNIRVGDALAGAGFDDRLVPGRRAFATLRARYMRSVGSRKSALARTLDREERRRTLARLDAEIALLRHTRREQVLAMRERNLFGERIGIVRKGDTRRLRARLRASRVERQRVARGGALPFSFAALFAEAQGDGGFDLIVGNPPWVRLHRIPEALRAQFRESFEVFRDAAWHSGAARAGASTGFASQVDLAALFVERSLRLLRGSGVLSLLLPVKLWQSLAGGGVRRLLLDNGHLVRVEDLRSDVNVFDAAVYPSLLVARAESDPCRQVTIARCDDRGSEEWKVPACELSLDASPGAPWLLLHPSARDGFTRLRGAGVALADAGFGAPRLGVKSGCNAAFLVRILAATPSAAVVQDANGERGRLEPHLLRPALRGDAISRWRRQPAEECILWTHDARGPLQQLPTIARAWLGRHYGALSARSDAARSRRWWSLFRVDAASAETARLVWADFGRQPRALVLAPGDPAVPMNTCYVLPTPNEADAWALAAILNSRVASAWLNAIAEPARGGYHRYLGWTVGQLPVPPHWNGCRDDLAAVALRCADASVDDDALDSAVLSAYGLTRDDVVGLLACDG